MSCKKRTFVTVSFAEGNPFDAELLAFIAGAGNRAGLLKKLAYDQMKGVGMPATTVAAQRSATPGISPATTAHKNDGDIEAKIRKMEEY